MHQILILEIQVYHLFYPIASIFIATIEHNKVHLLLLLCYRFWTGWWEGRWKGRSWRERGKRRRERRIQRRAWRRRRRRRVQESERSWRGDERKRWDERREEGDH